MGTINAGVRQRDGGAAGPATRIRVLGPISTSAGRVWAPVRGRNTRATLAALVISARHVVPVDRLVDAVWGDAPPPSADASLHSHISKLRHQLGDGAIRHVSDGYALDLRCSRIDACRFERLAITAERCLEDDPHTCYERARAALALWRGPPFGDIGDADFLYLEVRRLEDLRLAVQETALAAEIEIGRVAEAVAALRSAVSEHPYHERLWHLLAFGLAKQGRRVEAIAALGRYDELVAGAGLAPDERILRLRRAIEEGRTTPA